AGTSGALLWQIFNTLIVTVPTVTVLPYATLLRSKVNGSSAPITVAGGSTLTVTVQNGPGNQWDCVSLNASPNVNAAWLSYAFLTPFSTTADLTSHLNRAGGPLGVKF